MSEFLASFILNFFAELGDKTQLTAFVLASRFGFKPVAAGIFLAVLLLQAIAVLFGGLSGNLIQNSTFLNAVAGFIFLIFGVLSLRKEEEEKEEIEKGLKSSSKIFSIFILFFLLELGDKTQIATVVKASTSNFLLFTYLGAVAGFYLSNMIGVIGGKLIGEKVEERSIRFISSAIFIAFGAYYLIRAFFK